MPLLKRRRKRIPLPSQLVTRFRPEDVRWDDALLLMARAARDLKGIARLRERYGKDKSAPEIISLIPKRPPTPFRVRLLHWLQRLEGALPSDPNGYERPRQEPTIGLRRTRLRPRDFR